MARRIRVGVLFGGRSEEHEVSRLSAASVLQALDPARYEAVPLYITRQGRWLPPGESLRALGTGTPAPAEGPNRAVQTVSGGALAPTAAGVAELGRLDVVFPVIHGPGGEDGTLQGLLEICGLPYVGAGVLGSALGMDKIVQKDLLRAHGLPVADYVPVSRAQWRQDPAGTVAAVASRLGLPCFVKPSNLGSSVGITRAGTLPELAAGLELAAGFDRRVICERAVLGCREIECGVLGNERPAVSVPGEVRPRRDFYDFEAKYAEGGAELIVPADLPPPVGAEIQRLALAAFGVLDCADMARVDFFVQQEAPLVLVNEVNTIPGFTATSMYPRLWAGSGVSYRELLTRLIELALERGRA